MSCIARGSKGRTCIPARGACTLGFPSSCLLVLGLLGSCPSRRELCPWAYVEQYSFSSSSRPLSQLNTNSWEQPRLSGRLQRPAPYWWFQVCSHLYPPSPPLGRMNWVWRMGPLWEFLLTNLFFRTSEALRTWSNFSWLHNPLKTFCFYWHAYPVLACCVTFLYTVCTDQTSLTSVLFLCSNLHPGWHFLGSTEAKIGSTWSLLFICLAASCIFTENDNILSFYGLIISHFVYIMFYVSIFYWRTPTKGSSTFCVVGASIMSSGGCTCLHSRQCCVCEFSLHTLTSMVFFMCQ